MGKEGKFTDRKEWTEKGRNGKVLVVEGGEGKRSEVKC